MKKIIITLILSIVMLSGVTVSAYPISKDYMCYDFESSENSGYGNQAPADRFVSIEGVKSTDNTALKMVYDNSSTPKVETFWRPRVSGDRSAPIVSGNDAVVTFNIRIDSSSNTEAAPRSIKILSGTRVYSSSLGPGIPNVDYEVSDYLMQMRYEDNSWVLAFRESAANNFIKLCDIETDKWQNVVMTFHPTEGNFDVSSGGKILKDLYLKKEGSTTDAMTLPGFLDINFQNASDCYNYDDRVHDKPFTFYIDDVIAQKRPTLTNNEIFLENTDGTKIVDNNKVLPADNLVLNFSNEISQFDLTLNSAKIENDEFVKTKEYIYI